MKNLLHYMEARLRTIFLNKETTRQIHNVRNRIAGNNLTSINRLQQATRDAQKTTIYKVGVADRIAHAAGRFV